MVTNYFKQFMAWATGSKNNLFLRARFKLTFLYIAFIAAILVVFSVGLYVNIDKNVRDNISDKIKEKAIQKLAIEQTEVQLKDEFVIGDIFLLLVSGGLAFFMAGKNLRPIQDAMQKQKRFIADASHDLRTPLAIMKTDCEVSLKKKSISVAELLELTRSNQEEVERMSAMVEQLLFLSRHGAAPEQKLVPIALGKLVSKMANSFQNLAAKKNISLVVSEVADENINGNELDLERMFFNILKNALDYTPEQGTIEIAVRKNNSHIKLSIKDSGIGIAPEDLAHITEAFFKADKARSENYSGSGLGLSIVEEIVENHHGKLAISSQLGVGTEISVVFPANA